MNKFVVAALMAWQVPAFAGNQVFTAEAEYTKPGWDSRFNNLEQAGIERAAERRAYSICVRSGATDCVILEGAYITGCHYMAGGPHAAGCKAEASARGTTGN